MSPDGTLDSLSFLRYVVESEEEPDDDELVNRLMDVVAHGHPRLQSVFRSALETALFHNDSHPGIGYMQDAWERPQPWTLPIDFLYALQTFIHDDDVPLDQSLFTHVASLSTRQGQWRQDISAVNLSHIDEPPKSLAHIWDHPAGRWLVKRFDQVTIRRIRIF